MDLILRTSTDRDLEGILAALRQAFDSEEEAELTRNLLADPSAEPRCSLAAIAAGQIVGCILFSRAALEPESSARAAILAPLAVVPRYQRQGIGAQLIDQGLQVLRKLEYDLVFVLGSPGYYPRYGFRPAIPQGFEPPYPLPAQYQADWMVHVLSPARQGTYRGTVRPAESLDQAQYWWG